MKITLVAILGNADIACIKLRQRGESMEFGLAGESESGALAWLAVALWVG